MSDDLAAAFIAPLPVSFVVFAVSFLVGFFLDQKLRTISNTEPLRVVTWLRKEQHERAMREGVIQATRSGWGPLTGFPPYNWRVWSWLYSPAIHDSKGAKISSYGVIFDVYPGERIYRSLSKTFGPTVSVRSSGSTFSLAGRNPDFSPRVKTAPLWAQARMEDNVFASSLALFGLSYVVALAPIVAICTFSIAALAYWISLKAVKLT